MAQALERRSALNRVSTLARATPEPPFHPMEWQNSRLESPDGVRMVIDQKEIDALKAAGPTASPQAPPAAALSADEPLASSALLDRKPRGSHPTATQVERILKIQVPVIVQLCTRKMPISRLRRLSVGTIVEFERPVDAPLELLINNRSIATGQAVRVGEHFGFRISAIRDKAERIRLMGQ